MKIMSSCEDMFSIKDKDTPEKYLKKKKKKKNIRYMHATCKKVCCKIFIICS